MQFHPFSVTSLVCSGKGGSAGGGDEFKEKREGSWPLITLELEVGGGLAFTDAQFHELFLQVVIFQYLNSGLSVPFQLVLPIRKSLAISSACGFSPPLLVHGSTMDLEPGRCRRTDGKKWRCYGSVVPDQKYCERHMFRGSSQRSRKLVEASRNVLKSNNGNREDLLPADKKSKTTAVSVTNGKFSVPVSTTLNLTPPSVIAAEAGKNNTRHESNWHDSFGNRNSRKSSVAAGSGVSPKSVLQDGNGIGTGTGNGNLSFDTEELRCRRTDGKRWRCSRMVVPGKKYCENHMHRGAKKAPSAAVTVAAGGSSERKPEMAKKNYRVLDTNLSISVAVSPRQIFDGDSTTTTSSSSSDATTVSDENVYQFLHTF